RPTLFVTGFPPDLRAKDLAFEFERYGEIVRCDVPAPPAGRTNRYAFVEYVREDDAATAHAKLHGHSIDGGRLIVEWAKRNPGTRWRPNGSAPPSRGDYDRDARDSRGDHREPPRRAYKERSKSPRRASDRNERDREAPRYRSRSPRRREEMPSTYRDRDEMPGREARKSATPPPRNRAG
ncbi:RNA-binding domain-containing protein, partial [Serendipita vermifera]